MSSSVVRSSQRDGLPSLAQQYRRELAPYDNRVDQYATLIPADALPAVIAEIEASLAPIARATLPAALRPLKGTKLGDVVPDIEAFWANVASVLAIYPADTIRETVHRAVCTASWLPSAAELKAIADELIAPRRRQLRIAREMVQEHQRRAHEAAEAECRSREHAARVARGDGTTRPTGAVSGAGRDYPD